MELMRLSGIVIIIGFVVFWIGNLYSPSGVYSETDLDVRLELVDENPGRWALSQALGGVGISIIVLGLLILSVDSASDHGPGLTYLPVILNILATGLLAVWLYQYIPDPLSIWESSEQSLLIVGAASLILVAGILYGILFLQIGLPRWLSYLTIGYAIIALVAILIVRPPVFFVISIYFFILLATAIALIRQ